MKENETLIEKTINEIIRKFREDSEVCMAEFLTSENVPANLTFEEAFFVYMSCMNKIEGDNFYTVKENILYDLLDETSQGLSMDASEDKEEDTSLIVYPMDAIAGMTDEEMDRLDPEMYHFDPNDPYFHYDLKSGLLESLVKGDIEIHNEQLPENERLVMATPEQVFDRRWKNADYEEMTEEKKQRYNNALFELYESEGFADTFKTRYSDSKRHNGKHFYVVRRARENDGVNCDLQLPMWIVRFKDGSTWPAFPEEITNFSRNKS